MKSTKVRRANILLIHVAKFTLIIVYIHLINLLKEISIVIYRRKEKKMYIEKLMKGR